MKKFFSLLLCGAMLVAFSACEQNNEVNGEGGGSHEYVDLGLPSGTLWATCNVGATAPEQSGDYFAWAEVTPKDNYSVETYKWIDYSDDGDANMSKYYWDNKTELEREDDAASVNWGGNWRTPTKKELDELVAHCTFTETSVNQQRGCLVEGSNGNSIFLPIAGIYVDTQLHTENGLCAYMSSTVDPGEGTAWVLTHEGAVYGVGVCSITYGISVRPVMSKK